MMSAAEEEDKRPRDHPVTAMSYGNHLLHDAIDLVEKRLHLLRSLHVKKRGNTYASLFDEMETIVKSIHQCKNALRPIFQKSHVLIDPSEIFGHPLRGHEGPILLPPVFLPPDGPSSEISSLNHLAWCQEDHVTDGINNLHEAIRNMDNSLYQLLLLKVANQGDFGPVIARILLQLRGARECMESLATDYDAYLSAPLDAPDSWEAAESSSDDEEDECPVIPRMTDSVGGLQRALITLEKSAFDLLLRKFEEMGKESVVTTIKKIKVGVNYLDKLKNDFFKKYWQYKYSVMDDDFDERDQKKNAGKQSKKM